MARLYYEFNVQAKDNGLISMMCLVDEIVLQSKTNDDFIVRLQPFYTEKTALHEPCTNFEHHTAYCKDVDIIYELEGVNVTDKFEEFYIYDRLEEFYITSVAFYPDGDEEFSNNLIVSFTKAFLIYFLHEKELKIEEMNKNIE